MARPAPAASTNVALPATIRPWQNTSLHARVSGYLAAWHRDLGDRVHAGDLLAEIDTPELDQELAAARALAREATAAAAQARAERIEAQADLQVAEAQWARVRAELELAKSQLPRREKLLAAKIIPQEEYDTVQRQVEARTAETAAAGADVSRRRANLETRSAIIAAREATAQSRQSSVDRLEELQGFKRIVAPFNGVVTRRTAEIGMLVTAGQESLFVIEDLSRVRVQIHVPQSNALQVRVGIAARIQLPESVGRVAEGTVTRIAESVDAASRTMLAEVELENAEHLWQPGSYAQATLTTTRDSAGWTVPANTLSMRVDGPHLAVVNDQDRIEIRRVSLGRDFGSRVAVVEGIRGDERLVVNPGDSLTAGVQVQIDDHREVAQR